MYNGNIKRRTIKKKSEINFGALFMWYLGIVVSFLPIIIDMCVYLAKNTKLNMQYWINTCLKGDLLWILATIIVLTIIDYLGNESEKVNKGYKSLFSKVGMVLWGVVFAMWTVFKYVFPTDYTRKWPIAVTLIFAAITLIICTPLQVKIVEVE